jgi:hypothetical protein
MLAVAVVEHIMAVLLVRAVQVAVECGGTAGW